MNIFKDLEDKLQFLFQQLKDIHATLDELKKTEIELNNIEVMKDIEEVRILLRILRTSGESALEKFENRVEFLRKEQVDR